MRYLVLIFLLMIVAMPVAHAAGTVLEVGIPGVAGAEPGAPLPNIVQYISFLYTFVLGFVGIAGFASLVFWGAVWAGSGIIDKKRQAIDGIKNALYGIGIALVSFIILNTINPDLVVIKLPIIPKIKIEKKTVMSVEEIAGIAAIDGNLIFKKLKEMSGDKIGVSPALCPIDCRQDCHCTSLSQLPQGTFNGLLAIADNVGDITITGGTENYIDSKTQKPVHQEHGPGRPVVDLRYTAGDRLDSFIKTNGRSLGHNNKGENMYEVRIGQTIMHVVQEKSPPHWHIRFTQG